MSDKGSKKIDILISLTATIAMFAFCLLFSPVEFQTNDDFFLQIIANGFVSGNPEAHIIYSDVLWGLIISSLYRASASVDWYTCSLIACLAVGTWVILYAILKSVKSIYIKAIIAFLFSLTWTCLFFRNIVLIQYTTVSSFLGAAAILWVLLIDVSCDRKNWIKACVVALALVIISFSIREMGLLMMIPFAGFMWIAKFILEEKKDRLKVRRYLFFVLLVLGTVGILKVCNNAYYSLHQEWKDFVLFNDARSEVIDYNGFPNFEENQKFYDDYGLTYEDCIAIKDKYLILLHEDVDTEFLDAVSEQTGAPHNQAKDVIKELFSRAYGYVDRPINVIVCILWIAVAFITLISILQRKDFSPLIKGLSLLICRLIVWTYLLYKGRLPERVSQGLWTVELICLIYIAVSFDWSRHLNVVTGTIAIALGIVILSISFYLGIPKMAAIKGQCEAEQYYGTSLTQLFDYTSSRKQNIFICDVNALSNFARVKKPYFANVAITGSWLAGCPAEQETLSNFGINNPKNALEILNNDNVLYIFRDSELTTENYLLDYFKQYTNIATEQIDYIKTDCDINFKIIRIYEDK